MTAKSTDNLRSLLRGGQKEIQIPAGVNLHTDLKPGEMFEVDGFHIFGEGTLACGPDYPNASKGWGIYQNSPLLRLKSGEALIEGITYQPPLIDVPFHMELFNQNGAPSFPLVWVDAGTKTTLRGVKQPDINRGNLIVTGDDSLSPGKMGFVTIEGCNLCDRFSILGMFGSWVVVLRNSTFRNSLNGIGICCYMSAQGLLEAHNCILLDQTRCGLRIEGKNSRGKGRAEISQCVIHSSNMCVKFDSEGTWTADENEFYGEEAIRQNVRAGTGAKLNADRNLFACKTALIVVREGLDNQGPVDFTSWFSNNQMAGLTRITQGLEEGCRIYHDNWNGWTGEDDKAQLFDAGKGFIGINSGTYNCLKLGSFCNPESHIEAIDHLIRGYFRMGAIFNDPNHSIHPDFKWKPRLGEYSGRGEYYQSRSI